MLIYWHKNRKMCKILLHSHFLGKSKPHRLEEIQRAQRVPSGKSKEPWEEFVMFTGLDTGTENSIHLA